MCIEVLDRHRFAEVIPLAELAAVLQQKTLLSFGLDPFRDQAQPEALGHGDDRFHQFGAIAVEHHLTGEGAVDFQHVDGETPEIAQGRKPGTEIVNGDSDAVIAQGLQGRTNTVVVVKQQALGYFQLKPAWIAAGVVQNALDCRRQIVIAKLA